MQSRSRIARLAVAIATVALLGVGSGPLLAFVDAVSPFIGFRIFGVSLLLGVVALALGGIAILLTREPGHADRGNAWTAVALGTALTFLFFMLIGPAAGLPMINDITTSPDDPPVFRTAPTLAENKGRDMAYPAAFAEQQRAGYPDLAPIVLSVPPGEAFAKALRAAGSLGWTVTRSDPDAGELEATHASKIFRFVDDVVVRVRPDGAGARIDVRSKSRDGKGDLGANAKRIAAFAKAVQAGS